MCGRRVETWNITSVSLNPVYTLYSPVVSAAGGRGWGIRGKGERGVGRVGRESGREGGRDGLERGG